MSELDDLRNAVNVMRQEVKALQNRVAEYEGLGLADFLTSRGVADLRVGAIDVLGTMLIRSDVDGAPLTPGTQTNTFSGKVVNGMANPGYGWINVGPSSCTAVYWLDFETSGAGGTTVSDAFPDPSGQSLTLRGGLVMYEAFRKDTWASLGHVFASQDGTNMYPSTTATDAAAAAGTEYWEIDPANAGYSYAGNGSYDCRFVGFAILVWA